MQKFGQTLLFALFIMFFLIGAKMAIRVSDPYTRKLSPSLADALKNV